jgi:Domain of unknown function (DUF1902)
MGGDRSAGLWFVRTTNIAGLALDNPSPDKFLEKLPIAIAWVFREQETQDFHEVPFEVPLLEHERARIAS